MLNLRLGICVAFLVQTLTVGASADSERLKYRVEKGLSADKVIQSLPGKTLRVQDKDQNTIEGRFDDCTKDSLHLIGTSSTFAMPLEDVSKLWVRGPKAKKGFVIGLIAGGLAGAAAAGVLSGVSESMESGSGSSFAIPVGLAVGGLAGGLIGCAIGALCRGWNIWYETDEDIFGGGFPVIVEPVYVAKDKSIGLNLSFYF